MAPGVVETETTRTTPTTRVPLWALAAKGLQASGTEGTPRVQFHHGRARGHQWLVSFVPHCGRDGRTRREKTEEEVARFFDKCFVLGRSPIIHGGHEALFHTTHTSREW